MDVRAPGGGWPAGWNACPPRTGARGGRAGSGEHRPIARFLKGVFEGRSVLLTSYFVALDGEHIVGLSYLLRRPDGDAEVGDTGVLRSHRRRGIARTLKMMVTRYAAERGIKRVHTDNRADNTGMLAINRELGFVPGEQIIIFEKTLRSEA